MIALAFGIALCTIQLICGFLLPGMFFRWKFLSRPIECNKREKTTRSEYLLQCFGFGSIYLATQMFLFYWFGQLGVRSIIVFVLAKVALDAVSSGIWCRQYRLIFRFRAKWLAMSHWQSSSKVQFAVAVLFGLAATVLMPHALDNSAVDWLTRSLNYPPLRLNGSQGAISYIGLLHMPSLLLKGIVPVPTIAAGLKIFLSMLLAVTCKRIVESLSAITSMESSAVGWHALILQMVSLTTCVGTCGVFDTGKETVFSMLFLFVFVAELIAARPHDKQWYWSAALPLVSAIGFGAMAIPYAIVLVASYLCFSLGQINLYRFGYCCIAVSFLPLVVSIHAMADWNWLCSILVLLVPLLMFVVADRFPNRFCVAGENVLPSWIPCTTFFLSMFFVALFLPVHFHLGKFPLDGATGIVDVISHRNKFVVPGLFGIIIFLFSSRIQKSPGIQTLLVFPFVALIPALMMARWYPDSGFPIHPQNIWDWAKDVPRWLSGIYLGIFGVFGWHAVYLWASNPDGKSLQPRSKNANRLTAALVVLLLIIDARLVINRAIDYGVPKYTKIGGHYDAELAQFVEWAYLSKCDNKFLNYDSRPLIVADTSAIKRWLPILTMYGIRTASPAEFPGKIDKTHDRLWCIASANEVSTLVHQLGFEKQYVVNIDHQFSNESVFVLDRIATRSPLFSSDHGRTR